MFSKNFFQRTIVVFFLLALLFPLLNISKVFIIPHCLAFDVNDDANHTFINLQQWRRIFSQGEWPTMNVYNNFGTPLMGDVLTYPLSPLALTYAFLPGPVAMTVNRVLIGFVSLLLLFIFYHRRFGKGMSIGLGLCTFYAPGILWHSNHHHFQMSLLLLTGFFLLQEQFTTTMSVRSYLGICALSIIMFISVSLNVVMILGVLILGYQLFLSGGIKEKSFWIVLSTLACGMIAVFPDTVLFLQATSRSIRSLAEYPVVSFDGPNKIFWTPIVAAGIYSIALFREKSYKEGSLVFWLGFIPFCIVLLSRALPFLWKKIPLLGATDVVRLTWGAGIFLMIACAGLLLRWLKLASGWQWQIFVCLVALGVDANSLPFRQDWIFWGRWVLAFTLGLSFLGFCLWSAGVGKGTFKDAAISRWMAGFVSGAVIVFYLYYGFFDVLGFAFPKICHVTGHGAFSQDGSEKFSLPHDLLIIPKNSRVAYDFNTIIGLDLRGAREGLFGSAARSTIMTNADFAVELFNKELIQFDAYAGAYHFCPPWQARELQNLGISYVVGQKKDDTLVVQGWKSMGEEKGAFLYQSPLPTGVVFLKKGEDIAPVPFVVQGNGLNIKLPSDRQGPEQLVITLLGIPGWHAWIDGNPGSFLEGTSRFLVLSVSPNDHVVRVRYEPFSPGIILLCFLVALIIPWMVVKKYL
jgi:hypothetical protein